AAARVVAVPEPERALERLAGEILGDEPVTGEPGQVPVDVVQVSLGSLREVRHVLDTPPAYPVVTHAVIFAVARTCAPVAVGALALACSALARPAGGVQFVLVAPAGVHGAELERAAGIMRRRLALLGPRGVVMLGGG